MNTQRILSTSLTASLLASGAWAQQNTPPKAATATTLKANQTVANSLALNDKMDFDEASRGLIASLEKPVVQTAEGKRVTHCRKEMTADKVPKTVLFVDALPKPTVGKTLRRELRTAA